MNKKNYYKNYASLSIAIIEYNKSNPKNKINLIDFNVLSLIISFDDAGRKFYMTNKQIANMVASCERTVQSSVTHLCEMGFITKEKQFNGRTLILQHDVLDKFINSNSALY